MEIISIEPHGVGEWRVTANFHNRWNLISYYERDKYPDEIAVYLQAHKEHDNDRSD